MNFLNITNPLDQFEIRDFISINAPLLGDLHLSLTNIALYLIVSFTLIVISSSITNKSRKLVFNN
jgi:F-type H+-transporting ATPase subunit a